ncbi:mitogen-activated protein kinase 19-like [Hibiscus syriacus]|uniref:Mitogen-activated protein kinase 19-like n=1 Tax=Hibiscus syriacus TaxID=106335 RepID=A0A6A3C4Z9_HIBSY|nr:protein Jade-1-like [Hibiscus syriacus]KAE8723467.1 mitogen-activated protein kinase 19-like [Hibiscus syriacus]
MGDKWDHLVCALLVSEVFFGDPEGREMIDCSRVPEKRWKGKCYVCKTRKGCAIECSESKCGLEFHVTCGLNEDLCIEYTEGKKGAVVAGFCNPHTELWKKQQQTGKFKIVARDY